MVNLTRKHTVPGPIIMKKSPGGWDWSLKASHPKLCPGLPGLWGCPFYSKLKPGKRWKNPPLAKDVFTSGVTRLFSKASMAEKDMFWRSRVKLYFRSIGRNWKGIIKMGHVLSPLWLNPKTAASHLERPFPAWALSPTPTRQLRGQAETVDGIHSFKNKHEKIAKWSCK